MAVKRIFWLILMLPALLFSGNVDKLDARLKMLVAQNKSGVTGLRKIAPTFTTNRDNYLSVFIRGDVRVIKSGVESLGGHVNTIIGNILTAQVPQDAIMQIAAMQAVDRIKLGVKMRPRNERARVHVKADKVLAGEQPLPRAYTGQNVIVGIIDSGIDWKHEDFRDPADSTKSRILYIWDQVDSLNDRHPQGFNYGAEWTRADIEDEIDGTPAGIVRHKDSDASAGGHGTHVSGTAAGNLGLAPGADIIVVGLDFEASTSVVDAVHYIFTKAEKLGRPAVINASLGTHMGPHDGTSAESQAIDLFLQEKPGRIFCAAAGNEGSDYIHYGGFQLSDTPNWNYYLADPYGQDNSTFLEMYFVIPNKYLATISLSFAADSSDNKAMQPLKFLKQTQWQTVEQILDNGFEDVFLYANGDTAGIVTVQASPLGANTTELYVLIIDYATLDEEGYAVSGMEMWRLYSKGTGVFHAWMEGSMTIPDPAEWGIRVDDQYKPADNEYTVGMPGDGIKVITVGASVNRKSYMDMNGNEQPPPSEQPSVGALAAFSSHGPTVDNRLKPEIVAPGENVISALSSDIEADPAVVVADGKHQAMSGTSMATPVATGAIALLLQKNPGLTIDQVRSILFRNTTKDEFTGQHGALPNNLWGYGKLDIFAAITDLKTETEQTRTTQPAEFALYPNYPNPFNPTTTIRYSLRQEAHVTVSVFNTTGQEIARLVDRREPVGEKQVSWDGKNSAGQDVAGGVYFIRFNADARDKHFSDAQKAILLR